MLLIIVVGLIILSAAGLAFRTSRQWDGVRKRHRPDPDELLRRKNRIQRESYFYVFSWGIVVMALLIGRPLALWGFIILLVWGIFLYVQWMDLFRGVRALMEEDDTTEQRTTRHQLESFDPTLTYTVGDDGELEAITKSDEAAKKML